MAVTDSLTTLNSEGEHQAQDDARAKRAQEDDMDIELVHRGGCYEVDSASGNTYDVDLLDETGTCPDDQAQRLRRPASTSSGLRSNSTLDRSPVSTDGYREVPRGQTPGLRRVVRIA